MNPQEFINKWMNKPIDFPKDGHFECKDVFNQYNQDVVHAPRTYGNAKDLWTNYPTKFYNRITNTITAVPRLGDVIIWGPWKANPYGHVAICSSAAGPIYFTSFEQNWPIGSRCHYQAHNFFPWSPKILGWLRPKV